MLPPLPRPASCQMPRGTHSLQAGPRPRPGFRKGQEPCSRPRAVVGLGVCSVQLRSSGPAQTSLRTPAATTADAVRERARRLAAGGGLDPESDPDSRWEAGPETLSPAPRPRGASPRPDARPAARARAPPPRARAVLLAPRRPAMASERLSSRPACLLVASGAAEGEAREGGVGTASAPARAGLRWRAARGGARCGLASAPGRRPGTRWGTVPEPCGSRSAPPGCVRVKVRGEPGGRAPRHERRFSAEASGAQGRRAGRPAPRPP